MALRIREKQPGAVPPPNKKRGRRFGFLRPGLFLLLLIPLIGFGLVGTLAYGEYRGLMNRVQSAQNHLQNIVNLAKELNRQDQTSPDALRARLGQVKAEFGASGQDLAYIQGKTKQYSRVLNLAEKYTPFTADIQTARALLDAGGSFVQAGQIGLDAADTGLDLLSTLGTRSSPADPNKKGGEVVGLGLGIKREQLDMLQAALIKSSGYIKEGITRFNQIPYDRLKPGSTLYKAVNSLRGQLPQLSGLLDSGLKGLDTAQWLLGFKQPATYLLLVQDADELRPTGGFMGNFGVVTLDQGVVGEFVFDNTAALDNEANSKKLITTPAPYNEWWILPYRWGLRDVNLTPDFPDTAKMAQDLLKQELGVENVTGVIALGPGVIRRALELTGPIKVFSPGLYDDTVTAENFQKLIHYYQVGRDFEKGERERKKFTRLLAEELLKKVQQLPKGKLVQFGKDLVTSLNQKDLLLNFNNSQAQSWLDEAGWSGRVLRDLSANGGSSDYFYLVETNMSSNKTNSFVQHKALDTVQISSSGTVNHSVNLTYNYATIPPPDSPEAGPEPGYYSITRYYLPSGSNVRTRQAFDTLYSVNEQYGKSVWGQTMTVLPGQVRTATFGWDAPSNSGISPAGNNMLYRLTLQRQPGAKIDYSFNFKPPSGWKVNGVVNKAGTALAGEAAQDGSFKLGLGQIETDVELTVALSKNA